MKYVKTSNIPLIIGAILILILGLLIGLNINKKEVYTKVDMIASTKDNSNNSEITASNDTTEYNEIKPTTKDDNSTSNNTVTNNNASNITSNDVTSDNKKDDSLTTNTTDAYSNKDKIVITSLENSLNKINDGNSSDSSFADSAKGVFISIVDFLFYDGTINGITFDELTDNGKQKVLMLASKIDNAVESKIPGYKETISDTTSKAFNKASEIIKNGANNLNNFAKEKLGSENYQSIIDAKDELVYYTKNALNFLGDVGGKVFNSLKDKLDSWYQDFKKE